MHEVSEKIDIENMIYEIRGKQVMLDSDLAILYQCKNGTKTINQAVKRHINKFPERFMFQITQEEFDRICGPKLGPQINKTRFLPYVFTEQGVAMLSTVIKTKIAEEVSISIMDAFVKLRKYVSESLIEQKYINNLVLENYENIKLLKKTFNKLSEKRKNNEIYFNGQIYDAYSKIIDIFDSSKKELIIIDAYADKKILDMISSLKVKTILVVKEKTLLKELDIEKYNQQYDNLKIVYDNTFHDRYFIIDKSILYHCGTSLNHIGEKTFSINKVDDNFMLKLLLNKIKDK